MKPRALASAAGIAILLAAACGGAYSPPNDTATQSSSPSQAAGSITEKPFAPGGKIDMQLAAERILKGHDSLATIAADVGYESEAAFNRAFKRVTGVTPGRWREGETGRPPDGP